MENYGKEFRKFALSEGISSLKLQNFENGMITNLTPYVIEPRETRYTQIDVFSRLMVDRIIWASGVVDQNMADIIQAQLLFLDQLDKSDIRLHISSGGGSVLAGLSIVDVMNDINADVQTVNLGLAASMGSVLLSAGTKGKRSSLIHSRVMTHMVSHGTSGNVQATRIQQLQAEKYNYILFKILAENCGRSFEEVFEISRNDNWLNSDEALSFGIIDEIIGINKSKSISTLLEGFEEYYTKEVSRKLKLLPLGENQNEI